MTPEKLGLYELKYLEILHDVLSKWDGEFQYVEENKETIVLEYGKRIKEEVMKLQIEQTEGEVTDNASVE